MSVDCGSDCSDRDCRTPSEKFGSLSALMPCRDNGNMGRDSAVFWRQRSALSDGDDGGKPFYRVYPISGAYKTGTAGKEDDLYSAPAVSMLNQPSLGFLWYFAVMYAVGIIFNAKTLCDFAFWNGAVYFFAALAYAYQISTKHYLGLNKRTKSIPRKRLYAISAAMTGLFALLVFMAMVPSFFLGGQRRYTDIRTWLDGIEADGDWMGYQPEIGGEGLQGDDGIVKFLQNEPPPKPSEIWNYLWWIFVTLCAGLVVYGTIRTLQRVYGEFRDSFDENGDKVEALDEEPLHKEERIRQNRRKRQDSKTQRIRRMYCRTIQKHRKEPPARYESPSEIEKNAGLLGDADMERLHVKYENARYGRERV